MNAETKTFGIGAILTITDGAMMCGLDEVYGILGWLTGESLMTHQLPRASRESEGFLREQFPDLAAIDAPDWQAVPGWEAMSGDEKYTTITSWLDDLGSRLGATREVPRLPEQDHTRIDPLTELRMMRPDAEIIPVFVPGSDDAS